MFIGTPYTGICDCEVCPCCGKLRKRFSPTWTTITGTGTGSGITNVTGKIN